MSYIFLELEGLSFSDYNLSDPGSYVLLIRRNHFRKIKHFNYFFSQLKNAFPHEQFIIFDDSKPTPSLEELLLLFRGAKFIIGSHGMGLSNIIACKEGTPVFEYLPFDKPILCFGRLAQIIGLKYYASISSKQDKHKGIIHADLQSLIDVLSIELVSDQTSTKYLRIHN
jgi:hypothetical protein